MSTMRTTIIILLGMLLTTPAWAQNGAEEAAGETADDAASAATEIDREPVKCLTANRIRQTRVIDARTIVFDLGGGRLYRNQLSVNCPRLVQEKRFSYDLHTNRLCDTDFITVLEYWGSRLQEGPSCGLGLFYPITREEAELLDADPEEMLENAGAVEETVESSGEAVRAEEPAAPAQARPYDPTIYDTVDSDYREDE